MGKKIILSLIFVMMALLFSLSAIYSQEKVIKPTSKIVVVNIEKVNYLKEEEIKAGGTLLLNPGNLPLPPGVKIKYTKVKPELGAFLLIATKTDMPIKSEKEVFVIDNNGRKIIMNGYYKEHDGEYIKAYSYGNQRNWHIYFDVPKDFVPVKLMVSKEIPPIELKLNKEDTKTKR